MIPKELSEIVISDQQILGGTPCFKGTRVPLETFIDHIETGYSLDRFLKGYSSVRREQAIMVLTWFGKQSRQIIGVGAMA